MRAEQLLDVSEDLSHFVQAIADICFAPACMAEPLRLAAQVRAALCFSKLNKFVISCSNRLSFHPEHLPTLLSSVIHIFACMYAVTS